MMTSVPGDQTQNIATILKPHEAKATLKKTSTKAMFTNKIITCSFEQFLLTESNIDIIFDEICPTVCVTSVKNTADDMTTAISFSHHIPVRAGIRFDVTFYGSNYKDLIDHVIRHLAVLKTYNVTSRVILLLSYPLLIQDRKVEDDVNMMFEEKKSHLIQKIPLCVCYSDLDDVKKNCATHFDKLKSRV